MAGFALAIALAIPAVLYFARAATDNVIARTAIDPLVASAQLLDTADRHPDHLLPMVIGKATEQSLVAANQFDRLSDADQQIVLRLFTRLNANATLRSDRGPAVNAARLARAMVLCTRHHAQPGWVDFDADSGATVGVPEWVLDPDAKPEQPITVTYGTLSFIDPRQLNAIARQWDSLHRWVIEHQGCAAAEQLRSAPSPLESG